MKRVKNWNIAKEIAVGSTVPDETEISVIYQNGVCWSGTAEEFRDSKPVNPIAWQRVEPPAEAYPLYSVPGAGPDYNDGNWHGWNGGECPVDQRTVVRAVGSLGQGWSDRPAAEFSASDWRNLIVAFRVVKRAPREWWLDTGTGHLYRTKDEADLYDGETIHLREVIE